MKKIDLFLVSLVTLVTLSVGLFSCSNNNQKKEEHRNEVIFPTDQKQEKTDNSWLIGNWEMFTLTKGNNFGEDIDYMQFEITILSENKLYMSSITKLTDRGWLKQRQQNHYSSDSYFIYAHKEYEYTIDNERNAIYCGPYDSSNPIYFNKENQTLNISGTVIRKKPPIPKEERKDREDSYVDCYERIITAAIQAGGIYSAQWKELRSNDTKTNTKFIFEKDKKDKNILSITICEETQNKDKSFNREIHQGQFCFRGFQSKKWQLMRNYETQGRYAVFSGSKEDGSIVNCYLNTEWGGTSGTIYFTFRVEGWKEDILYVGSERFSDYDNSLKNITQQTANDAIDIDKNGYGNNVSALNRIEKITDASYSDETQAYSNDTQIYSHVDNPPSFSGGEAELMKWLQENLKYPISAQEQGIQGRVILRFVVNRDGSIRDIEVKRSLDPSCDEEAIRLIKSMPKWIPGKQNGRNVTTYYTLPVAFRLQ